MGYLVLQRINGGETPVQPGTKVGDTLNELTGGRLRDLVDRADSDPQQERLAVGSSQDNEASIGSQSGRRNYETTGGSPRRRRDEQTTGKAGEEGEESGARSAEDGMRDLSQGTQAYPEDNMSGYNLTVGKVVDWKTEFQREGLTT